MRQRYRQAITIGIIAGIALIISHLIFVVLGLVGSFLIPFFGCALGCLEWLLVAAFLIGVGWYAANAAWATGSEAIKVSAVAGAVTGVVSQSIGLLIGLAITPLIGIIGAVIGYVIAGDYSPLLYAFLIGIAAISLSLFIVLLQFLFWVAASIIFSAIGGAMYSGQQKK
jgi:hypothetical protein